MDELLDQFLIEGRELIALAHVEVSALQKGKADTNRLSSLFRAFHSLKGLFAVFSLRPAERVLHIAEDRLSQARSGARVMSGEDFSALTAVLDQTDRWIDQMERAEALDGDADGVADQLVSLFASDVATANDQAVSAPADLEAQPDWVSELLTKDAAALADHGGAGVAFRYTPDPQCFFRGDDPLAVVEAVPDLLGLRLSPSAGTWPNADDLEPFACFTILEGLSGAPEDAVRAAFRLQPNEVEVRALPGIATPNSEAHQPLQTSYLRIDATRIDNLAERFGDLLVAINGLAPLAASLQKLDRALGEKFAAAQGAIERAAGSMQTEIAVVRSVPLATTVRSLPRMAREVADELGKQMTLTVTGDSIEVDKRTVDGLFEPLLHLLRNAIDHGIEAPAQRLAAGKSAAGTVNLSFRRLGDMLVATLSDDGAGIDPAAMRRHAELRGLIGSENAAALDDEAALRLIFLPGFSTASVVTSVSGRGVGMDAVQTAVNRLRGTVEIESQPGEGTTFRLVLPAATLVNPVLTVMAGGDRFGVLLDQVVETTRIGAGELKPVGTGWACVLRDRTIPVLDLAELLGLQPDHDAFARLILVKVGADTVALRVSALGERIDTVVKQPGEMLAGAHGLLGSAVMGDGTLLVILDLAALAA